MKTEIIKTSESVKLCPDSKLDSWNSCIHWSINHGCNFY